MPIKCSCKNSKRILSGNKMQDRYHQLCFLQDEMKAVSRACSSYGMMCPVEVKGNKTSYCNSLPVQDIFLRNKTPNLTG